MKTAIFGGAFDPPHSGHINLVRSVREKIKPDKVLIIPTGNAPHKATMTPYDVRFKLAQAAFVNCGNCEISDIENKAEECYTIDTLRKLHEIYPGSEFFLIIGSDIPESLDNWKEREEIPKLCTVISGERDLMSSSRIREMFKPKRYIHSMNVAMMCGELSKKHKLPPEASEKAYIAGILHDITKKCDYAPDPTTFEPTPEEIAEPKLWHAITGAKYVRDVPGITDTEIINAIRFHTVARPNMSVVEKIVYIADKISAERDYKGVEELRALAFINLDLAVYTAIKKGMKKAIKKDGKIPAYTTEAYNYYNKENTV
jgi:nicotinate-nucleotide adenylyltransferase